MEEKSNGPAVSACLIAMPACLMDVAICGNCCYRMVGQDDGYMYTTGEL